MGSVRQFQERTSPDGGRRVLGPRLDPGFRPSALDCPACGATLDVQPYNLGCRCAACGTLWRMERCPGCGLYGTVRPRTAAWTCGCGVSTIAPQRAAPRTSVLMRAYGLLSEALGDEAVRLRRPD